MDEMRIGGRRILSISPELLVEFAKRHDGARRTYSVEKPLPDDARIVSGRIAWNRGAGMVEVVLESAEWQDESAVGIPYVREPTITVHYLDTHGEG